MSNLNKTTVHLKKAGERLSRLSLEERYERVLALARQFLTAKASVGCPFPEEEASYEDAAFLVTSWQDQKHVNSAVECLTWVISSTLRAPQPIRDILPEQSSPRQAVVF